MERQNFNPKRVRMVATLDFVLTMALVVDITCFTVYPIWAHHYIKTEEERGSRPPPAVEEFIVYSGAIPDNRSDKPKISPPLLWTFLGAVILFGLITVLAAAVLLKSTSEKVDSPEALQIIRFWIHCNWLTLVVTLTGLVSMYFLWMANYQIGFPTPMLFYFGIRLLFTWAMYQQLKALRGPRIEIPFIHPAVVTAVPIVRHGRYYGRPGMCSKMGTPGMGLGTYKGAPLSAPKCQCLGFRPQNV